MVNRSTFLNDGYINSHDPDRTICMYSFCPWSSGVVVTLLLDFRQLWYFGDVSFYRFSRVATLFSEWTNITSGVFVRSRKLSYRLKQTSIAQWTFDHLTCPVHGTWNVPWWDTALFALIACMYDVLESWLENTSLGEQRDITFLWSVIYSPLPIRYISGTDCSEVDIYGVK